jgi:hypothetical protein
MFFFKPVYTTLFGHCRTLLLPSMLRCVSTKDHRNMVRSQPMPLSATVAIDRRSLLLRAGDVERNPGPIFLIFLVGACVVGGVGATTAITQTASEEKDAPCDTECDGDGDGDSAHATDVVESDVADEDAAAATAANVRMHSAAAAAPSVLDIDEAPQEVTAARDGDAREDVAAVGVQAEAASPTAESAPSATTAISIVDWMTVSLRSAAVETTSPVLSAAAERSQPASPIATVSADSSERSGGHSANSCGTPISSVEQDAPDMRRATVEPQSPRSANPSFAEPQSPKSANRSFADPLSATAAWLGEVLPSPARQATVAHGDVKPAARQATLVHEANGGERQNPPKPSADDDFAACASGQVSGSVSRVAFSLDLTPEKKVVADDGASPATATEPTPAAKSAMRKRSGVVMAPAPSQRIRDLARQMWHVAGIADTAATHKRSTRSVQRATKRMLGERVLVMCYVTGASHDVADFAAELAAAERRMERGLPRLWSEAPRRRGDEESTQRLRSAAAAYNVAARDVFLQRAEITKLRTAAAAQ